jgi:hypothetical protein
MPIDYKAKLDAHPLTGAVVSAQEAKAVRDAMVKRVKEEEEPQYDPTPSNSKADKNQPSTSKPKLRIGLPP